MTRLYLLSLLLLAAPAFGQGQGQPQPTIEQRFAMCAGEIEQTRSQRENLSNTNAAISAVNKSALAEIDRQRTEIERLTKLCGDACKPKDESKK